MTLAELLSEETAPRSKPGSMPMQMPAVATVMPPPRLASVPMQAPADRDTEAAVLDEVLKQYLGGRGIDQITAGDVRGKIEDAGAVDGVLAKVRRGVDGMATKGEQLRAIKTARNNGGVFEDISSPTGYRDPGGRFAAGGQ